MSSPPDGSKEAEANRQRQSNLQRIQQRKQAVRCWPLDKKLEKLAIYSSCKAAEDCKCNEFGSKNLTCDCDGKCSCKPNIVGDTCDQCEIQHYDFPNCKGILIFKLQFIIFDKYFSMRHLALSASK